MKSGNEAHHQYYLVVDLFVFIWTFSVPAHSFPLTRYCLSKRLPRFHYVLLADWFGLAYAFHVSTTNLHFQNLLLPQHSCAKPPTFTSPLKSESPRGLLRSSPFSKKKRPISNAPTPSVLLPPPFKQMSLISTVQNFKASRSVSTDIFITVSNLCWTVEHPGF